MPPGFRVGTMLIVVVLGLGWFLSGLRTLAFLCRELSLRRGTFALGLRNFRVAELERCLSLAMDFFRSLCRLSASGCSACSLKLKSGLAS